MVFSKVFLEEVGKEAKRQQRAQDENEKTFAYWAKCPACGERVARRQILAQGCWVCAWKGTEEELECARAGRANGQETKIAERSYRTICPGCGRRVITEELRKKGCYICGWQGGSFSEGLSMAPSESTVHQNAGEDRRGGW
ncbi:hypothetical protein ACFLXE_05840 [Chloroflexota bacterium]